MKSHTMKGMKWEGSLPNFLVTGAEIHIGYCAALEKYLESVRRFGKTSLAARSAMKTVQAYLSVKNDKDNIFYRRHWRYEGPSPFYCNNALLSPMTPRSSADRRI